MDYPKENKITVVCHLWSYRKCHQATVKLELDRTNPKAPTLENVWKSANWFEREVFDLYGVIFEGHSDLRRIMMPEDYPSIPYGRILRMTDLLLSQIKPGGESPFGTDEYSSTLAPSIPPRMACFG